MELPRRRAGAYETRSVVGNVLAPVSGAQGSAELRTTPSARGNAASRPPWATELDAADSLQSPPSHAQRPPSGRSPSAARQHGGSQPERGPHAVAFRAPVQAAAAGRPLSAGGPAPADQLDLWTRQQQQQQHHQQQQQQQPSGSTTPSQGRRGVDGLYARVEHVESTPLAGAAAASGPAGRRDVPARLPPGDLGAGDRVTAAPGVARRAAGPVRGNGGTAAAARVTASPARGGPAAAAAAAAEPRVATRSSSTPKPRPVAPPKRSTSITDNVRNDWVDVGTAERRAGGAGGARGGGGGGGGSARWDSDPDGGDRGSWLFSGEAGASEPGRGPDVVNPPPHQRPGPERRRHSEQPMSARRSADGGDYGAGGDEDADGAASPGGHAGPRRGAPAAAAAPPSLPRRPRAQSPAEPGALDVTFSSGFAAAAAAPAPVLPGGMSLGHGASAGVGEGSGGGGVSSASSAAGGSSRGSGRPGATAPHLESARQVQALQEENARLRDQVQHLERLLATAAPSSAAAGDGGRGRRAGPATAVGRPSSAGVGEASTPGFAAAAAGGVVLQQYKSQIIQLQRQVAVMSLEIEAKSRLGFEAEGALLEVAAKLAELATAGSSAASGDAALPGDAAEAAAAGLGGGGGGGGGGGEALSRDRLLQLVKWSKQMLGRLKSEKCESSKIFTREGAEASAHHRWSDRGGGGGGSGGGDAASCAPTWAVPFLTAGGNRFLTAGTSGAAAAADDLAGAAGGGGGTAGAGAAGTTVAAVAGGQAALLADPLLAHRLEMQLAGLAPKMTSLAVLLKTQLLPAMPWLGLEAADRLQAEVGEAAEGVAQSVEALVQLCSLLPAGAAMFGEGPVSQEPKRRAAEVEAGRDSWLYGSPELVDAPEPPSPAVNEEGVVSVPRLQAAIAPLLRDRKTGNKALADILEPVRARSMAAAAKRAVLEAELRFAARAAALHAEHVSHLMLSVGLALEECRGAKDAAAIKSYFNAAAAVRQVLEAADALELHPCETCLKALVDVIRVHRDTLASVPELLVNAPAADVEGRLLAKVEELHQGFKKAVGRLDAHKRRHLDGVAVGGTAGGAAAAPSQGDQYSDDEEGDDWADDDRGAGSAGGVGGGGGAAARGGGNAGLPPARRPPSTTSAQPAAAVAKPGKPPKPQPRPDWQD